MANKNYQQISYWESYFANKSLDEKRVKELSEKYQALLRERPIDEQHYEEIRKNSNDVY